MDTLPARSIELAMLRNQPRPQARSLSLARALAHGPEHKQHSSDSPCASQTCPIRSSSFSTTPPRSRPSRRRCCRPSCRAGTAWARRRRSAWAEQGAGGSHSASAEGGRARRRRSSAATRLGLEAASELGYGTVEVEAGMIGDEGVNGREVGVRFGIRDRGIAQPAQSILGRAACRLPARP